MKYIENVEWVINELSKKVQILMSTYNGERYIRKQIDSILNQDYPQIELLIRDDGSTDGTIGIISNYAIKNNNIKYYVGDNYGTCNSFFDLIQKADNNSDYYAFADQDDYWLPNKITRAIEKLEEESEQQCLLYSCVSTVVNEKLQPIKLKSIKKNIKPSFENSLIENICIGCSMVFNNALYKQINQKPPKKVYMHDWWLYIVASCFGKVLYDNESFLLYRQHSNNVIGMKDSRLGHWKKRILNFKKMKCFRQQQIKEIKALYNLRDDKRRLIEDLEKSNHNIIIRIRIVFGGKLYRQKLIDDIIFKVLILISGF